MIPITYQSSLSVVVVFCLGLYAAFSVGALAGGSAALNESQIVEDLSTEFAEEESQVKANITNDQPMLESMLLPIVSSTWAASGWGIEFGAASPTAARVNGELAPFVMVGGVLAVMYLHLKELRRHMQ